MEKGTVKRFLWLILPVIGVIFSVISSIKSIFASLSAYAYSVKRKVLLCIAIYALCCIPIVVVLSVFSIGFVTKTLQLSPLFFLFGALSMHLSGLILATVSVIIYNKAKKRRAPQQPQKTEENEEVEEIKEKDYPRVSSVKSNLKLLLIPIVGAYIAAIRAFIDIMHMTAIETANPQAKVFIAIKYLAISLPHEIITSLVPLLGLTLPLIIAYLISLYGCAGIYILLQISWTKKWNKNVPPEKRLRLFK